MSEKARKPKARNQTSSRRTTREIESTEGFKRVKSIMRAQPVKLLVDSRADQYGLKIPAQSSEAALMHSKTKSNKEVRLLQKALRIAGSPMKLAEWVRTPVPSLNGRTPYAAMQSAQGRKDLAVVLTRIEHGVY